VGRGQGRRPEASSRSVGLVLAGQPSRDSSPAKQAGRVWSSRSLFTAHASRKQAQPMLGGETSGKQAQSPSNCRLLSPPTLQRALSASDCGRLSWWTRRRASFSSEAPLNCRPERSFQEEVSLIQAGLHRVHFAGRLHQIFFFQQTMTEYEVRFFIGRHKPDQMVQQCKCKPNTLLSKLTKTIFP